VFEHLNVVDAVPVPASQQVKSPNVMTFELLRSDSRRLTRHAAFSSLLGVAAAHQPSREDVGAVPEVSV
jgi:hypothetical protein